MTTENKNKRSLKTEPKLGFNLSEEQKEVRRLFYEYDVNFIVGDFGSGKTATACHIALSSFRKKEFNKIVITRPIVSNKLGYLPGPADQKMSVWVAPIVHNFNMLQPSVVTEKMLENLSIEILPIDFAKGITYFDSVVIIDECFDMNYEDFRTMLTRLGKDSKIIFCGSMEQIDRSMKLSSCWDMARKLKNSGLVAWTELKSNHRNPILTSIIKALEDESTSNNDKDDKTKVRSNKEH